MVDLLVHQAYFLLTTGALLKQIFLHLHPPTPGQQVLFLDVSELAACVKRADVCD